MRLSEIEMAEREHPSRMKPAAPKFTPLIFISTFPIFQDARPLVSVPYYWDLAEAD